MENGFKTFFNEQPGPHPANAIAKEFVDKFQEWLREHEAEVHDGGRCPDERANIVAYIVHRLGFGTQDWEILLSILEWYEAEHERHEHEHSE